MVRMYRPRVGLTLGVTSAEDCDSREVGRYHKFEEDSEYFCQLHKHWDKLLKDAFKKLPPVTWSGTWDLQEDDLNAGVG